MNGHHAGSPERPKELRVITGITADQAAHLLLFFNSISQTKGLSVIYEEDGPVPRFNIILKQNVPDWEHLAVLTNYATGFLSGYSMGRNRTP